MEDLRLSVTPFHEPCSDSHEAVLLLLECVHHIHLLSCIFQLKLFQFVGGESGATQSTLLFGDWCAELNPESGGFFSLF